MVTAFFLILSALLLTDTPTFSSEASGNRNASERPSALAVHSGPSRQEEALIRGRVQDQQGSPVPSATIALYDSTGMVLITGTASGPEGEFTLRTAPGSWMLQISFVSHSPYRTGLELAPGEEHDLGTVTLPEVSTQLDEVVVEGERSMLQMNFDSRVFTVGEDITSMGGNALDVLDRVPSVATDFEGNISLRGSEGVQILINGRPSSLVRGGGESLRSIPAELIERVEVITNPSARYPAQGSGGIINIILKENVRLGFNGSVAANTGIPQDHGITGLFNWQEGSINWFMQLDSEYESRPGGGDLFQRFSSPDTSYIYREQVRADDSELEGRMRGGAEIWLPADQHLRATLGVQLEGGENRSNGDYTDYRTESCPRMACLPSDNLEVARLTDRKEWQEERESEQEYRLEYENRFGPDHRLTVDLDYERGGEWEEALLRESLPGSPAGMSSRQSDEEERYRDLRIQADYQRPIGPGGRLEAGLRSNFDRIDNEYQQEELREGVWVTLPALEDNFRHDEIIHALYAIWSGQTNPFSWQIGLRAERTSIRSRLDLTDHQTSVEYLHLFPALFLTWQLNEGNSLQASYSRRVQRPWARMLLPFPASTDSRSYSRGNPQLRPEFSNSFDTGWMRYWETGSVLASLYYRYRTGVFEQITGQENDAQGNLVTVRFPINLSTEQAWGLELTGEQEITRQLQLSAGINLFRSRSRGNHEGQELFSQSDLFQGRMQIRWRFLRGWNFHSSLRYLGPRESVQGRRPARSFIDLGLSRELIPRTLILSLSVRDLLDSRRQEMVVEDEFFFSERMFHGTTRSVRLTLRYQFGGE